MTEASDFSNEYHQRQLDNVADEKMRKACGRALVFTSVGVAAEAALTVINVATEHYQAAAISLGSAALLGIITKINISDYSEARQAEIRSARILESYQDRNGL